ncbi:MAG TPA: hypothetical protein VKE74_02895, partial [Gemmataceae bacterium]|nr:hypothetical protein [Gemmataceae bacterium]
MNTTLRAALAVALVCLARPALAAEAPDPADLFPPGTLAYAELHDPAEVVPQVAAAVKGSTLEDSLAFIHKRRDTTKDIRDINAKDELAIAALFTSPEMLAELKKVRGIAVGVTGFSPQGQPDFALAVVTGESNAVGLAVRLYLTTDNQVRRVGTVGAAKVPIYQYRSPSLTYNENGRPQLAENKPPTEGAFETTLAYTPGLFVIGTSKAAVEEVVTRFTGETRGGLSGVPAFKDAAAAHRRPGVFFYANAAEFSAKFDAINRARGGVLEPDLYAWLKLLANAKAVKTVAGCVRFRDGGLSVTVGATFDAAQKSPLVDFLSGSGVKVELLHPAPRPAAFAFVVNLPEKDRAAAAVGFLDAIAKANGEIGRLPSDAVRELEQKYKVPLSDGLIAKTRSVTVVFPARQELPKGAKAFPMLVLHTETPEVATAWEEFMPKLVADLTKASELPQPASEMVSGVRVLSLTGPGLPWNAPVHYARSGSRFVAGLDRKLVAAAALADPVASVVGGDRPAVMPPAGNDLVLIGTVSPGLVLRKAVVDPKPDAP